MASPNIAFDTIPSSIRKPGKYFEFNTRLAVRTLPGNLQRLLIVGQKLASGTAVANAINNVFSEGDAATLFGRGSICHLMVRAALRANPYLQMSVIGMDDAGAGVAATGTDTIANNATSAGVATITINDQTVEVVVTTGDTPTIQAAAIVAQIAKQPDLPVTAANVAGVITFTAKNKGTLGNAIKITAKSTAGGSTHTVVAMANGATDPTLATALSVAFSDGHNVICSAWNDQTNLTALRTHLDNVSGSLEQRGAVGVYGNVGTMSAATTLAGQINSGRITAALLPSAPDLPYVLAAAYAAIVCFEEDPARPLNLLALTGILANPIANRLSRTEQENCLNNGVTPLEVGPGDKVQIVRAITTYTLDAQSIPDISLLDLTTIRTLDYVRKAVRERLSLRFPREKLSQRTEKKVRDETIDVLIKLEELEILEQVQANLPGLIVERDLQDPNRLNIRIPADVVNGLHIIAGRIDLLL